MKEADKTMSNRELTEAEENLLDDARRYAEEFALLFSDNLQKIAGEEKISYHIGNVFEKVLDDIIEQSKGFMQEALSDVIFDISMLVISSLQKFLTSNGYKVEKIKGVYYATPCAAPIDEKADKE